MSFYANGMHEAVAILQNEYESDRDRFFQLDVAFDDGSADVDDHGQDEFEFVLWLFVTAVEENPKLTLLRFIGGSFGHPMDALSRLFGDVLETHPSWNSISFHGCNLLPAYVEQIATSFAKRKQRQSVSVSLKQQGGGTSAMDFFDTALDHRGTKAIANMLRSNTAMNHLELTSCGIPSSGCKAILEALNGNTVLVELHLWGNTIGDISAEGMHALANSNLRILDLDETNLTTDSVGTLVQGLRSNFSLEELDVRFATRTSCSLFEELLITFNFTLQKLWIDAATSQNQLRIDHLLRLNHQVRCTHNFLKSRKYHVPHLALWPLVLEGISSKPTLLYNFLRQGNLCLFVNQQRNYAGIL